jgi:hypothetical protein
MFLFSQIILVLVKIPLTKSLAESLPQEMDCSFRILPGHIKSDIMAGYQEETTANRNQATELLHPRCIILAKPRKAANSNPFMLPLNSS